MSIVITKINVVYCVADCGFIEHAQVHSIKWVWPQSKSGPALHTVSESGTAFARPAGPLPHAVVDPR